MNPEAFAFFFEIQQIPDDSLIFDEFKKHELFFSYFQIDHKYYLFFYGEKSIDTEFFYQAVYVIQELDTKKRKIPSLRSFFLYPLELMKAGQKVKILTTNCIPLFWRKVETVIRQNKKAALQEFLFESQESIPPTDIQKDLKDKIESLENQVFSLQRRIVDLETTQENSKYAIRGTLEAPETMKSIQQGEYNLGFDIKQETWDYIVEVK